MKCPICASGKNQKTFGSYIKCSDCTSLFLKSFPKNKTIQKLSDEYADVIFDTEEDKIESIHIERLQRLEKFIPKNSKFLMLGVVMEYFFYVLQSMDTDPLQWILLLKSFSIYRKREFPDIQV